MLYGRSATRKIGHILMPMYAVDVAYYFYVAWRVVGAGDNHTLFFVIYTYNNKKKETWTRNGAKLKVKSQSINIIIRKCMHSVVVFCCISRAQQNYKIAPEVACEPATHYLACVAGAREN